MSLYIGENKMNLHIGETKVKLNALNGDYIILDGKLVWANPSLYLSNEYIDDKTIRPYINTGISQDSNSDLECVLYTYTRTPSINNCVPFGCWQLVDSANKIYAPTMMWHWNNQNDVDFMFGKERLDGGSLYNKKHKIVLKNKKYFIDGVLKKEFTSEFENEGKTTLFIMPIYYGSKFSYVDYPYAGRIYSYKVWNNGILVRYFVPVPTGLQIGSFTVPSNGMWDIVTQQFFGNSGTGEFSYGRDE